MSLSTWQILLVVSPNLLLLIAFLCAVATFIWKGIQYVYLDHFVHFLSVHFNSLYLYGIPLARLYGDRFFPRFRQTFNYGFCYAIATLSMLALRDVPSSRIVLADVTSRDGQITEHEWVEFRYGGVWWVIDPTWCDPWFVRRSALYKERHLRIKKICTCAEFWQYPISAKFETKLRDPGTSCLFFEIYVFYTPPIGEEIFPTRLAEYDDFAWHGRYTNSYAHAALPDEVLLTKSIVHDYVFKPKRLRPKAKHIRYAYKLRRLCRRELDKLIAQDQHQSTPVTAPVASPSSTRRITKSERKLV